jgi:hypothetical protein
VPRAGLLKAVLAGRISNAQSALALQLSVPQFQRVKAPSGVIRPVRLPLDGAAVPG